MDLNEFWVGMLGAAGAAAIAWFSGLFRWFWGLSEPMRTRRRERRETQNSFWERVPDMFATQEKTAEAVGRMTGEIRVVQEQLKAQDGVLSRHGEALADTLAMTQGEFESSPVARFTCDEDGRNIAVNAAYCTLVGLGRDDMTGMRWRRVVHPDDLERHLERFGEAREGHYELDDCIRLAPPGRPEIRVRIHMIPHPRAIGPALRWHGTVIPL